jgi:glyceraldehyde 3-phosphate dehydrogenase
LIFKFMNLAINGFGRIGRSALRRIINKHSKIKVVAINDLSEASILAHLLKYDSLYGKYDKEVKASGSDLIVGKSKIRILAEKDPVNLPWHELKIDVVLECSGAFTKLEGAKKHLEAGAKKVIISAPSDSEDVPTYLLGVNVGKYKGESIISMGSCTTNCLAPVVKILNDAYGLASGFMTTVHSYTNDQRILDLSHKDLRRARAAAQNIIPTSTGAAKTVAKCLPELVGKLDGLAMRVPTAIVSITDFVCTLEKGGVSFEEINGLFKVKAAGELKGVLGVTDEPLVSMDFKGDTRSSIVDLSFTMVKDNLVKVIAWYDNEWGYACRLAEMAEFVYKK